MNTDTPMSPAELIELAEKLKVLAEPKRLQIVNLLMEGVQCNCELGEHLDMAPNLISHHLRLLRQAGFVTVERDELDGRWLYYSINRDLLETLNASFGKFFDPARIQSRRPSCGPQQALVPVALIESTDLTLQRTLTREKTDD